MITAEEKNPLYQPDRENKRGYEIKPNQPKSPQGPPPPPPPPPPKKDK